MRQGASELAGRARRALSRREYPVVPAHIGRLDYAGADIVVGVTSRTEILSRLRPCAKEPWTVAWLERTIRAGDVLYDVGANVGAYSLIAASLGREGVRIVAVEPAYASYAALADNVLLNGLEDVIVPLPVLLGERTGMDSMGVRSTEPGSAEHAIGAAGLPVLSVRLEDLVARFGLPAPTVMKIDVDGGEAAVLAGAPEMLAPTGLRSVLVEIEREGGDAVVDVLAKAGFALTERVDERAGRPLARVWYGIFERG
jgi:FkbM family methyltransferase